MNNVFILGNRSAKEVTLRARILVASTAIDAEPAATLRYRAAVRQLVEKVAAGRPGTCHGALQAKQRANFSAERTSIVEPERPSTSTAKWGC